MRGRKGHFLQAFAVGRHSGGVILSRLGIHKAFWESIGGHELLDNCADDSTGNLQIIGPSRRIHRGLLPAGETTFFPARYP